MSKNNLEQRVSDGIINTVDNLVLQVILRRLNKIKMYNDEIIRFQLNECSHYKKQRILLINDEGLDDSECVFCDKPVNEIVVIYRYKDVQIICLESEINTM